MGEIASIWFGNVKRRKHLGEPRVDEKTILT
jgi:hypothetical protein